METVLAACRMSVEPALIVSTNQNLGDLAKRSNAARSKSVNLCLPSLPLQLYFITESICIHYRYKSYHIIRKAPTQVFCPKLCTSKCIGFLFSNSPVTFTPGLTKWSSPRNQYSYCLNGNFKRDGAERRMADSCVEI